MEAQIKLEIAVDGRIVVEGLGQNMPRCKGGGKEITALKSSVLGNGYG